MDNQLLRPKLVISVDDLFHADSYDRLIKCNFVIVGEIYLYLFTNIGIR